MQYHYTDDEPGAFVELLLIMLGLGVYSSLPSQSTEHRSTRNG